MNKVALLTCTGGREELFKLCRVWIADQTRRHDEWVIVDDGGVGRSGPDYVAALALVPAGHHVVVIEDDDWYPPHHVETLVSLLERGTLLCGSNRDARYHVPARRFMVRVKSLPNIGCMAFHASIVQSMAKVIIEHGTHRMWKMGLKVVMLAAQLRVAIKGVGHGLPGRTGATDIHDARHMNKKPKAWSKDPDGAKLREWIGKEASQAYFDLVTTGISP